ncbi:conserved hypothetical protein [Candidatus Desulfosporosinus infrequens]|uniref:Uncharacterized protein n=1 Tax=Candidatus Desulfosporosinus infrequens TaxID=2043169 RepID=A0A2U3K830_9FIRM|nr:conserved hypothetical protein [Candidatus Desulfosporosinus infrequens]
MWPKRKIQLVASSAAPGIDGVRAVLKEIQLEFSEVEPSIEDLNEGCAENWFEKPFDGTFQATSSSEKSGPATELVFWPGGAENDFWRRKALTQGMNQQSIQSFIHNILEGEQVLLVSEPMVFVEGRPLLGHILNEAGFEPTILWQTTDGKWQCERRQGLHWLIPESWWAEIRDENKLERGTLRGEETVTWVVRENGVDFYHTQGGLKFVGKMPRWSEPSEEQVVYQTIAKCLDIGVSWLDIRLALSFLWNSTIMTDNLRWNDDDFGWNARTCGEKLPSGPFEYVEDWWAR